MPKLLHLLALTLIAYAVAVAAASEPAQAEIASVGGSVTIRATPTGTVGNGTFESDTEVSVWQEFDGFLTADRSVQHDGTTGTFSTYNQLTAGTLFSGTYVQSYLVSFDPVGSPNTAVVIGTSGNVTITFTEQIIGVFAQSTGTDGLNDSDGTFVPSGTNYTFTNGRRFNNSSDIFTISTDGLTLTIDQATRRRAQTDQLRILINPEPSTGLLFGIGLAGAAFLARRRRRRKGAESRPGQHDGD